MFSSDYKYSVSRKWSFSSCLQILNFSTFIEVIEFQAKLVCNLGIYRLWGGCNLQLDIVIFSMEASTTGDKSKSLGLGFGCKDSASISAMYHAVRINYDLVPFRIVYSLNTYWSSPTSFILRCLFHNLFCCNILLHIKYKYTGCKL